MNARFEVSPFVNMLLVYKKKCFNFPFFFFLTKFTFCFGGLNLLMMDLVILGGF